jgi:hypothetical protein
MVDADQRCRGADAEEAHDASAARLTAHRSGIDAGGRYSAGARVRQPPLLVTLRRVGPTAKEPFHVAD